MKEITGAEGLLVREKREAIKAIELLEPVNAYNKACLALVILGLKPACGIGFGESDGRYTIEQVTCAAESVRAMCKKMHLPFIEEEAHFGEKNSGISFTVGSTPEALTAAKTTYVDTRSHIPFGDAMGFPRTASEAFDANSRGVRDVMIDHADVPQELAHSDGYKCHFFGFSREHWKEEVKVAEAWAAALKKHSPTIFDELVEYGKK